MQRLCYIVMPCVLQWLNMFWSSCCTAIFFEFIPVRMRLCFSLSFFLHHRFHSDGQESVFRGTHSYRWLSRANTNGDRGQNKVCAIPLVGWLRISLRVACQDWTGAGVVQHWSVLVLTQPCQPSSTVKQCNVFWACLMPCIPTRQLHIHWPCLSPFSPLVWTQTLAKNHFFILVHLFGTVCLRHSATHLFLSLKTTLKTHLYSNCF